MLRITLLLPLLNMAAAVATDGSCTWKVVDIPRIHADDVPTEDFMDKYWEAPVIIQGIADDWAHDEDWYDLLRDSCPKSFIPIMKKGHDDPELWANLEPSNEMQVDEFLDYLWQESGKEKDEDKKYGFDLVLTQDCPAILPYFKMPRYFNECIMQNDVVRDHFEEVEHKDAAFAWPTMMVGPQGTTTAMHTDIQGLPFWMMMLEGRKHFRIFPYKANYNLTGPYPTEDYQPPAFGYHFRGTVLEEYYGGGSFDFDTFNPDFTKYPKLCDAVMHEAILEPGEILFVPNSAPHGVHNLDHTVGISSNFFHPRDKSQKEWLILNCNDDKAEQLGFSPKACKYMMDRVEHRENNAGPVIDLDVLTYMDEHYFAQNFDEEL